jgi:hypothetical protein
MRFLSTLLISVALTTLAAINGAWQLDHENQWKYTYNPINELCMGIASAPGYMLMLSPNNSDNDRPSEAWPIAWKIAPISGVFWGIILGAVAFTVVKISETMLSWRHLTRKDPAESGPAE